MDISLVTLGDPHTPTGGYLYHLKLAELAADFDCRLRFVSFPEWPYPMPVAAARRVRREIVAQDPNAIVLDSIAAAYLAPQIGSLARPLVGMLHQPPGGIDGGRLRRATQAPLDRRAWDSARRLLVASEALAREVSAMGFSDDKIAVVPPGCDVPTAAEASEPRLGRERGVAFLCVGNWVARKGILDLLDAFATLPRGLATLHLVGDPDANRAYARRVRARLSRDDLAERVVVHGVHSKEEVGAMYREADVFVLASYVEPYGTVYGEALAAGVPVVGWDRGNLPHLAVNERDGLIVPAGERAALAEALRRIATDDALRSRLAAGARRRGESLPTWNRTAEMFFREVRDAAQESAPVE